MNMNSIFLYDFIRFFLRLQDGGRLRRNSAHRISRSSKKVWKPSGHWIRKSLTKSRTKWNSMPIFLCHASCNKKILEHLFNCQPSRTIHEDLQMIDKWIFSSRPLILFLDCDNGFRTDEDSNGFFCIDFIFKHLVCLYFWKKCTDIVDCSLTSVKK